MAKNNIVQVNSSLSLTAAAALDYSTLLVIDCNHNNFSRATVYSSPDDYSSILDVDSKLRKALDSAFSASVRPAKVVAGRAKGNAVLQFRDITSGTPYDVTVNTAGGDRATATYVANSTDTAQDIAQALKSDIDAISAISDSVVAAVVGEGAEATLEISLTGSASDFTLSGVSDSITVSSFVTEAPADTLAAITEINSQWTYIVSTEHSPSYQLAMASTATVLQKLYFTSTKNEASYQAWDGVSTPSTDDIMALFSFNQYDYAHAMYHHQSEDYPEACRVTEFTFLKPGKDSFQYNKIGVFPLAQIADESRPLNTNELYNIASKNGCTIISMGGNSVIGSYGGKGNRMASGITIEAMAVKNYLSQEILRKTKTLLLRFRKLAMNDADLNLFRNAWASVLDRNVSAGAGQAAALDPSRPYVIKIPRAVDIPFEDRVDGVLRDTKISCFLDRSIDKVIINIDFTYNDPDINI